MEEPVKDELPLRRLLQELENLLIERGFDKILVETDYGSFKWKTTERAEAAAAIEEQEKRASRIMH